jgi:hypothetical protein
MLRKRHASAANHGEYKTHRRYSEAGGGEMRARALQRRYAPPSRSTPQREQYTATTGVSVCRCRRNSNSDGRLRQAQRAARRAARERQRATVRPRGMDNTAAGYHVRRTTRPRSGRTKSAGGPQPAAHAERRRRR